MKGMLGAGALALLVIFSRQEPEIVHWRTDFEAAQREAISAKKPLLVVFQCERRVARGSDAAVMRPQDPKLARLLSEKFVPVRLVSLKGVDLNRFHFDYDQTFMAMGQTVEGKTLFRWSPRDNDPMAIPDLTVLLERPWPASGKPTPALPAPRTLLNDTQFAQTRRAAEPCYHCHYAHDAKLVRQRKAGTFQKSQLFRYPPPETLGITLKGAASPKIKAVALNSLAAKAGVQAGDVLVTVNGQSVSTAQDVRYALDMVQNQKRAVLSLNRTGTRKMVALKLMPGWRVYDISDRPSQGAIPPVLGIWEEPLQTAQKQGLNIPTDRMALKVSFLFSGEKWKPSQGDLRIGDVIVEADGKALPAMTPRQFHTWIRLNKDVGQTLALTVLRGSVRVVIEVKCIEMEL